MIDTNFSQASKLINIAETKQINKSDSKTKILTITSGKGGVGKSTLSANIAYLLSLKKLKIAVLDADIGLANMQVLFDIKPDVTFFEYINGQKKLNDIILETKYENISLIAGKSGYQYASNTNSFLFSRLVKEIVSLNIFDILIIDTGAGLNEYVKEFLSISKNILAVTTTDPSALTDVYSLIKMLSMNKDELMICFNHTKNFKIGQTITNSLVNLAKKNRLKDNFMLKYIGSVSQSEHIFSAARQRKLFTNEYLSSQACSELTYIVQNILLNIK